MSAGAASKALAPTAAAIVVVLGVNWHNLTVIDVVGNYVISRWPTA